MATQRLRRISKQPPGTGGGGGIILDDNPPSPDSPNAITARAVHAALEQKLDANEEISEDILPRYKFSGAFFTGLGTEDSPLSLKSDIALGGSGSGSGSGDPLAAFRRLLRDSPGTVRIACVGDYSFHLYNDSGILAEAIKPFTFIDEPLAGFDENNLLSNAVYEMRLSDFLSDPNFVGGIVANTPNLIVLSLGSADVRNNFFDTTPYMAETVAACVELVRDALPGVPIVLITPPTFSYGFGDNRLVLLDNETEVQAAQRMSNRMRTAYRMLDGKWSDVLLVESHERFYGLNTMLQSPLMLNSTHFLKEPFFKMLSDIIGYIKPDSTSQREAALQFLPAAPYRLHVPILNDLNRYTLRATGFYKFFYSDRAFVFAGDRSQLDVFVNAQPGDIIRLSSVVAMEIPADATISYRGDPATSSEAQFILPGGSRLPEAFFSHPSDKGILRLYRPIAQ